MFYVGFQVISKKRKVFTEIKRLFLSDFRWSTKEVFTEFKGLFLSELIQSPKYLCGPPQNAPMANRLKTTD